MTMEIIFDNMDLPWNFRSIGKNPNFSFEYLLKYLICKLWNFYRLTKHPDLTFNIVLQFRGEPWDWKHLSSIVSIDDIKQNPYCPWDFKSISSNKDLTIVFVLKNKQKKWCWYTLSRHPKITIDDIEKHPELSWHYPSVSFNPNLNQSSIGFITKNIDEGWFLTWLFDNGKLKFSIDMLKKFEHKLYKWDQLSRNKNMTIEIIRKFKHKQLYWIELSKNSNITYQTIIDNDDLPWEWAGISQNPNVTLDIIIKNKDKPWDWNYDVSRNPNLTIDFVIKHKNEDWDWFNCVSELKDLTVNAIESCIDKDWDWDVILKNPEFFKEFYYKSPKFWEYYELTFDIIKKNEHLINRYEMVFLQKNEFTYHNKYVRKRINERCKLYFFLQKHNKLTKDIQRFIIENFI